MLEPIEMEATELCRVGSTHGGPCSGLQFVLSEGSLAWDTCLSVWIIGVKLSHWDSSTRN